VKNPAKFAVAAAIVLLTLAMPAAADRLDEVKARGKLVVGVSDTTPPFSLRRRTRFVSRTVKLISLALSN